MKKRPELLRCPCCGGHSCICDNSWCELGYVKPDTFWVECDDCGIQTAGYGDPEEAVAVWNKRMVLEELTEDCHSRLSEICDSEDYDYESGREDGLAYALDEVRECYGTEIR